MTQPITGPERPAARQSLRTTVSRQRLIMILVGIMLGMLLAALDQTIVGTAMPRVIAELNGLEHYAWVATAYMLTSTVMVPIYGKLSDIYGRRPFFIAGMVIFLAGSALSGASQDIIQLIIFRAVQGIGAAAMMPIAQAVIGDIFPPAQRAKWQGAMIAVFGLATIIGPTAGGWITDNMGWRWVFYVNLPLGALAIAAAGLTMPAESRHIQHRIDYLGATTLVAGALPLLLAFSWGGSIYGWLSPQIVGLVVFALAMFVAFFFTEKRASEPIISPSLFKNRIFTVSAITSFLASGGMFGAIMFLPLFVQGVIGVSATDSGAVLTPMMLGFMASSLIGGQVLARTGRYKLIALAALAIGTLGILMFSQMDVNTTREQIIRNMIIAGLGLGVPISLFTIVVQNAFTLDKIGEVTANIQFFRSIGGTISMAVLGSVMTNRYHDSFQANLPATFKQMLPPDRLEALQNPQLLLSPDAMARLQEQFAALGPQGQELSRQLIETIRLSMANAISGLFIIGAVIMALAFIATLFIEEIPLRNAHHGQADGEDRAAKLAAASAGQEARSQG